MMRGGVALIVTGGLLPMSQGHMGHFGVNSRRRKKVPSTGLSPTPFTGRTVVIAMQLLHAGRYARHPANVAPSALQSPISPAMPHAMSEDEIERTFDDATSAALAKSVATMVSKSMGL